MPRTVVYVTEQFPGFHRWRDAPDEIAFLGQWHRHLFHVKLAVAVSHNNRDVEFFTLKKKLNQWLGGWRNCHFEHSCEQIALLLLKDFNAEWVDVGEDGENGAIVYKE